MECPKCHKIIPDNSTVCPHCHKVIALVCPNCHARSRNSVCQKCGYIILEKCAKCGKLTPTNQEQCKCGFSVSSSIARIECEADEFASLTVKFGALGTIRNILSSPDLYSKFLIKLKNLILAQLKNTDGRVIIYGNEYVINFNKELSYVTSVNKAVRMGIKILNAFTGLNIRMQDELGTPLKISILIQKKTAEDLLVNKSIENNVKLLMSKKEEEKFLKGMQIIMDEFTRDCIIMEYKTDSLFLIEQNGMSVMYYELLLNNYILPPASNADNPINIAKPTSINKNDTTQDIYSFKVFNINAKCNFESCYSDNVVTKIKQECKILSLRGEKELQINTNTLRDYYTENNKKVLYVACTEEMNYKPWGFFEKLFKDAYRLSSVNGLINLDSLGNQFEIIKKLILNVPVKTASPEDARFAYMEAFCSFLTSLKDCVIIVDGFENLDDTSIQTLEIFFDNYKNIETNFIFITDKENSVHSKIKGLLNTPVYTEITLLKNNIATLLSGIKDDAADFIKSFYYEKIKENFDGSKFYFDNAIKYLIEKDVLVSFKNKLVIKNNNSVMLPKSLKDLIKHRLKAMAKYPDASLILAYSGFLGERLDFQVLEQLGVKNIDTSAKTLNEAGFTHTEDNIIYINNYPLIKDIVKLSLKPEVEDFLAKNIIAKIGKLIDDTTLLTLMGVVSEYKEQYLLLWKNSKKAIEVGDYDAYLKNSLGFLSIIEKIGSNISRKEIEANKKEVYQNILMSLYGYSPAKIYPIENILLIDAINSNDDEKISKLSNLMLQGALISSNYTNALSAMQNILERVNNPSLIVDGVINTRFLLLSLVNIEILFNIGEYKKCIELGEELLNIIRPDKINSLKPANFSLNLFASHLADTFRLVAFAKLLTMDKNLDKFFDLVKISLDEELPEKDCIIAIKEFLQNKKFTPSNIENHTPFSKVIFLILQELSEKRKNYKLFAQNIYQAKLLASEIHETILEYICDLLIAYAYAQIGIHRKANVIFNDVLEKSQNSANFNVNIFANYFIASAKIESGEIEEALVIVNNALENIQRHDNSKIFYAMYEKLYIKIAQMNHLHIDIIFEQQKLKSISPNNELERIVKSNEFVKPEEIKEKDNKAPKTKKQENVPTEEQIHDLDEFVEEFNTTKSNENENIKSTEKSQQKTEVNTTPHEQEKPVVQTIPTETVTKDVQQEIYTEETSSLESTAQSEVNNLTENTPEFEEITESEVNIQLEKAPEPEAAAQPENDTQEILTTEENLQPEEITELETSAQPENDSQEILTTEENIQPEEISAQPENDTQEILTTEESMTEIKLMSEETYTTEATTDEAEQRAEVTQDEPNLEFKIKAIDEDMQSDTSGYISDFPNPKTDN